jgi:uncharacterized protein (TIGR02271 family)
MPPTEPEKRINIEKTNSQFNNDKMVIPIIEEEATVEKYIVPVGKVNISKRIEKIEEVVDVPTYRGEVNIKRIPVNSFVEEHPTIRHEGDTMIIPVVQEQVVMVKKIFLVEELHVQNRVIETHQPQTVTLMKDVVEVQRTAQNENLDNLTKGIHEDASPNSI